MILLFTLARLTRGKSRSTWSLSDASACIYDNTRSPLCALVICRDPVKFRHSVIGFYRPDFAQDVDRANSSSRPHVKSTCLNRGGLGRTTWIIGRTPESVSSFALRNDKPDKPTNVVVIYKFFVPSSIHRSFPASVDDFVGQFYDDVISWLPSCYRRRAVQAGRADAVCAIDEGGSATVAPHPAIVDCTINSPLPSHSGGWYPVHSSIAPPHCRSHPTVATSSVFFSPNGRRRADA